MGSGSAAAYACNQPHQKPRAKRERGDLNGEREPSVSPGVTSPGNWAPRVAAATWKLLIEKALRNLLLAYLICSTKGETYTKLGGLVSKHSLHSAWPGIMTSFPGKVQFNPWLAFLQGEVSGPV